MDKYLQSIGFYLKSCTFVLQVLFVYILWKKSFSKYFLVSLKIEHKNNAHYVNLHDNTAMFYDYKP
jgi:hypothetical protein